MVRLIPDSEPAPTIGSAGLSTGRDVWVTDNDPLDLKAPDWHRRRRATTIVADSRVFQPGGHHVEGEQSENSVRVTEQEATVLQGFPSDYPWQGSRTKKFEQIGNAVPPQLAHAIVAALVFGENA